jgi:rubredoxin
LTEHAKCPECKISNTVDFWDSHTKQEMGVKENQPYMSAGVDKKDHDEVESRFHCPMCNKEVEGIHLIRED